MYPGYNFGSNPMFGQPPSFQQNPIMGQMPQYQPMLGQNFMQPQQGGMGQMGGGQMTPGGGGTGAPMQGGDPAQQRQMGLMGMLPYLGLGIMGGHAFGGGMGALGGGLLAYGLHKAKVF